MPLRAEDVKGIEARSGSKKKKSVVADNGGAPQMSQISGVKRPLCHANSFTGEKLPKHGVETRFEDDLGEVSGVMLGLEWLTEMWNFRWYCLIFTLLGAPIVTCLAHFTRSKHKTY